ncbi:hypothetical protein BD410DRAFT_648303 [Rickenella mellea]|uniref:Uncharacterized protein n=1 Tax=Rickenella mellea TaxID=50990 RepID=A0A4Y7PM47_9AGAM|nr:hypothetical protein BD410DRAFT_648303 [Rickenella mellea]
MDQLSSSPSTEMTKCWRTCRATRFGEVIRIIPASSSIHFLSFVPPTLAIFLLVRFGLEAQQRLHWWRELPEARIKQQFNPDVVLTKIRK